VGRTMEHIMVFKDDLEGFCEGMEGQMKGIGEKVDDLKNTLIENGDGNYGFGS